ncbi:dihydropteroate synthase [candidate division CSSED10-310 bacterium]|uniref:Dihydropteroate synthase n=1 Tax=candidate division CSSED10-310 bacterium TaxID=2855610 RepID=A0ABV6YRG0_UNCC1
MADHLIRAGHYTLTTGSKTLVMGILNVTPDSFSDGGLFLSPEKAVECGLRMAEEGADVIDVGGESTRPFSQPITVDQEKKRVLPVIEKLTGQLSIPISIDTYKYEVAKSALAAGASIVNDITALTYSKKMVSLIAKNKAGVILMHMKGTPRKMQRKPEYGAVVPEIYAFLAERISYAQQHGIAFKNMIIDPGIGFGKLLHHNLALINELEYFATINRPIMVGASRKSFIGAILNDPVNDRLEGSLATAVMAVARGAHIVRVHDVRETVRAVTIADAIGRP